MKETIAERLQDMALIESTVKSLGLVPLLQAEVFRRVLQRYNEADKKNLSNPDTLRSSILLEAASVFNHHSKTGQIQPDCRPPIASFTGQFNPPTNGHESFIENLRELGVVAMVGPDSERDGISGITPLKMRRFLIEEWLRRTYPEAIEDGEIIFYPDEDPFAQPLFSERIRELHEAFPERKILFCCGADTLKSILTRYPQTILSGPILCMRRKSTRDADYQIPIVDKNFFLGLIQEMFKKEGPLLMQLFREHPLEPLLRSWIDTLPNIKPDQVEQFIASQPLGPEALAQRILGSERIDQGGRKLKLNLTKILECMATHARLATDPFALEQLQAHITYIETSESPNSSTRDRELIANLPSLNPELISILLGDEDIEIVDTITETLNRLCEQGDWDNLRNTMRILGRLSGKNLVGAVRKIVNACTLAIFHEFDLMDLYRNEPQTTAVPVSKEVREAAQKIDGGTLSLLTPHDIEELSQPAQFSLARALAGAMYEWEPDHPDPDVYISRKVHSLLARTGAERNFRPSVLIDRENGNIIAYLATFRIGSPAVIKYTGVRCNPIESRKIHVVEQIDRMVESRIQDDRRGRYDQACTMIVEAPAHDARFIEQHILGGTKFIPCGLEPSTEPSRSQITWNVQGIHLSKPQKHQGDYYVVPEAIPLVRSINQLVQETYGAKINYGLMTVENEIVGGEEDQTSSDLPQAKLLNKTPDGFLYKANNQTFGIYPEKSRHLEMEDFLNPTEGTSLLECAISTAKTLFEEGKMQRPYLKMTLPIDTRHSLQLQETLIKSGFHPVRFVPATQETPPLLTFCRILGKPKMNQVELPLRRGSGMSAPVENVFRELQKVGEILSKEGEVDPNAKSSEKEHIRKGKTRLRRMPMHRQIVNDFGYWEIFPSLYAHYEETLSTVTVVWRNINQKYRPTKKLAFSRHFVGLHDCGKAIWALTNRFIKEELNSTSGAISSEEIRERLRTYLAKKFPSKKPTEDEREDIILKYLQYNEQKSRHEPVSDEIISADLIEDYLDSRPELPQKEEERLRICAEIYRKKGNGEYTPLFRTDSIEEIKKNLSDPHTSEFAVMALELIDNLSPYPFSHPDGTIDLRKIKLNLEQKKAEVLSRYGDDESAKRSIEQKFFVLLQIAQEFFRID